ncbi:hypothetical protein ACLB2K_073607 [Fragaria x ananassa]
MAGSQLGNGDKNCKEQLFVVKLQLKTSLVDAIVDPGSQKNLISEALVQKLGLQMVILGNPYLWDRDVIYERKAQKYTFTKDGQRFVIRVTSLPPEASLVATTQDKRLVNACRKFVLLTRPHEGHSSQDVEKSKLKKSQAKYKTRSTL